MPPQQKKKTARFADEHGHDLAQSVAEDCGDDRESSAEGSNNNNGSSSRNDVRSELQRLAGADNRNVRIWKTMVVLIISIAGAMVSLGIHFYLKLQEEEEIKDSVSTTFGVTRDDAPIIAVHSSHHSLMRQLIIIYFS